jgi:hypothetical protein
MAFAQRVSPPRRGRRAGYHRTHRIRDLRVRLETERDPKVRAIVEAQLFHLENDRGRSAQG